MNDITQKIKFIYTKETIGSIVVKTLTHAGTRKVAYKKIGHDPWIKI